jgi:hypothetical protein
MKRKVRKSSARARHISNHSQTCGFRKLVTIFERFLLLKIVRLPCFAVLDSREPHGKPHRNVVPPHHQGRQILVLQARLPVQGSPQDSRLNTRWSVANRSTTKKVSITSASVRMTASSSLCWLGKTPTLRWTSLLKSSGGSGTANGRSFLQLLSTRNREQVSSAWTMPSSSITRTFTLREKTRKR